MSRTQRRNDSDTGQLDGHIFIPATVADVVSGAGAVPATPPALGVSLAAGTAYQINLSLTKGLIMRYGVQDDLQEAFGTSQPLGAQGLQVGQPTADITTVVNPGSNVSIPISSTEGFAPGMWCLITTLPPVTPTVSEVAMINAVFPATFRIQFQTIKNTYPGTQTQPCWIAANVFTTPAGVSGSPPFAGVSQFQPVVKPRPKGILLKQLTFVFQAAAALTTNDPIISLATYSPNQPPSISTIVDYSFFLPVAASGAGYYVIPLPIPVAKQLYLTTRYSQAFLSWSITGAAIVVGVFLDVAFNLN